MTGKTRSPVLQVKGLSVSYLRDHEATQAVDDISFSIDQGQLLALVGESGSGKTTVAQSVIGLLPGNGRIDSGEILLNGVDISRWNWRRLQTVRGRRIGLVPQDPAASLNPVRTIGANLGEVLRIHTRVRGSELRRQVVELLARVGIDDPERRARQYPHELSGGMRQRVLIASAIALRPDLIIADEPTSALDVTVQKVILDLLDDLRREYGTAILFVTHDLAIAAERSTEVVVLRDGRVQEHASTAEVLSNPRTEYARTLLRDAPALAGRAAPLPPAADLAAIALRADSLVQTFALGRKRDEFRAVDDVSFAVPAGTTHALVGESGSGKTTSARIVVGFRRPTSGRVEIDGIDLASLRGEALRQARRTVQLVYQNPYGSLDPRRSVEEIVTEPLRNFGLGDRRSRLAKAGDLIERVALPASVLGRRPHELSGGQRQRVAIARALVLEPRVVVFDEAVSALDVTVQAQVLRLLEDLQRDLGLTYLFVSHDLSVVRHIAHTVSVMRRGRVVEEGPTESVFGTPVHEYTRTLIDAIPRPSERVS
ncbi:MAG: glutathione transporter ATP-binding protein [Rhodoglobus sp.]|nr:glutathione transporter ATP-binding protein [Rhodoglobus sp.]